MAVVDATESADGRLTDATVDVEWLVDVRLTGVQRPRRQNHVLDGSRLVTALDDSV